MMLSALALDLHRLLARERWLPAGSGLLIALSGGGDSTALLRLFWELAPLWNFRLQAAHLNHNLRPEAENEAAFARRLCQKLDIPYWLASQPIAYLARSRQLSLEEAGRQARYAFLERLRREEGLDFILTAHTAQDQAETLVGRFISGVGLSGLRGIRQREGQVVRPLLNFRKEQLLEYLRQAGQSWCEDQTNHIPSAPRTKIRLEILPRLQELNPQIVENLNRLAHWACEDEDFFQSQLGELWPQIVAPPDPTTPLPCLQLLKDWRPDPAWKIARSRLEALHPALRKRLYQKALQELELDGQQSRAAKLHPLESCHYQALEAFLKAPNGKWLPLPGGLRARWERDYLLLEKPLPLAPVPEPEFRELTAGQLEALAPGERLSQEFPAWNLKLSWGRGASFRPQAYRLSLAPQPLYAALEESGGIYLRPRRAGDYFHPAGGRGGQKVKKYLQSLALPAAVRERLPLLEVGGKLLWLLGLRAESYFLAPPYSRESIILEVQPLQSLE